MRKIQKITAALLLSVATVACTNGAQKANNTQELTQTEQSVAESKVNHSAYEKLLQAHVSDKGAVDYKGFAKDKVSLENYLKSLGLVDVAKLSKNEQTAFWINAYNALTIDLIVKNYPVKSIQDIASGKPWDQKLAYKLNGKSLTLNDIEKKILLGSDLFDARIHFAVNCAAVSCPTLSNHAFTGDNVQKMLTENTKAALANPKFNKISADSAALSKLFDWYKADFVKAEGSVVNFINKYSATKISDKTKITYIDYNWSLNGK
ncbi:MAG TPA: DUF547 domain-containing protein [Pelobium sp.]